MWTSYGTGFMIHGGNNNARNTEKKSGELGDITGTVYSYDHDGDDESAVGIRKRYGRQWTEISPFLLNKAATPTGTPSSSVSPTPKQHRHRRQPALEPIHEQMDLPVQYPRRCVIMKRDTKKRKIRKRIE